ncbi:MAG: TonB-dependent receptor, partial [Bacteroidota bacterium]
FLFAIALTSLNFVWAQTSSVTGTVKDANGVPLESVNVSLEGTTKGDMTDGEGRFEIEKVAPGSYKLVASGVGFETSFQEINVRANENYKASPISLKQQSVELEEVTVSAGKNQYSTKNVSSSLRQQTEISKLPQNIQVITSVLLRDQQVTSIMEGAIRNVSGVTMLEHWGHFARVHMRGFRIPAFRNGFNVTDTWGPLADDMAFVERIEFIKGPSSFMLTAGEPGGIYNVVTKKPTVETIGQLTLMGGTFDFLRGSVDLGGKLTSDGKLLYRLNALYQTEDSHRGDEDVQRFSIAPNLTYNFSDKTSLNAEWNYHNAESFIGAAYTFGPGTADFGSLPRDFKFRDSNYPVTNIEENTFYVNFNHKFSEKWSATAQLGRLTYDQDGYSAWINDLQPNGDAFRSIFIWDARSEGNYGQAFVNGYEKLGNISNTILAGIDYTDKKYYADFYSGFNDTVAFNILDPTYGRDRENLGFDKSVDVKDRFPDPYNTTNSLAFYVQDEIGLLEDRLRLTIAGRYTILENGGTTGKEEKDEKFTPRIGLSFDLTENFTVFGLYDESFVGQNGVLESGEALDPEESSDIEGGIKSSFFNGKLKATLGAFLITKKNLALGVPNVDFFVQTGEVQSRGIEFDLQGEITPGLNVVLNYANTNVEITEDINPDVVGNRIAGHARHMTNGWLTYSFQGNSPLDGFGLSLGYQYQINRSSWSVGADNDSVLPDYFRLDGGLFWKNDKFRVQLNVNNLTDKYLLSGADFFGLRYWQSEPGINGRIAITYNFM